MVFSTSEFGLKQTRSGTILGLQYTWFICDCRGGRRTLVDLFLSRMWRYDVDLHIPVFVFAFIGFKRVEKVISPFPAKLKPK